MTKTGGQRMALRLAVPALVLGLVSAVVTAPEASATEVAAKTPKPVIAATIDGPDVFRIDRQEPPVATVTFTGVDAKSAVRVNWGDGGPTTSTRGRCGARGAAKYPKSCAVTLTHVYGSVGQFTATAAARGVQQQRTFTVVAAPIRWTPPADWVQPAGWSTFGVGATYTACETIPWYFDRSGEPAGRAGMEADIALGLAMLSQRTKLNFVQTTNPAEAELTFNWRDLNAYGANVAGVGGPRGKSRGVVSLSTTNLWTLDEWAGAGLVLNGYYLMVGRAWLVVHEAMHAMGFDHVEDPAQIMYGGGISPSRPPDFGAGDLDGLWTMYGSLECPVIPD